MVGLAALLLAAHAAPALTRADAERWRQPVRTVSAASPGSRTSRLRALNLVVQRLDSNLPPERYQPEGPSGL